MKKVYISGGLGNQMFQYAFYLSLVEKGMPATLITNNRLLGVHNGLEIDRIFDVERIKIQKNVLATIDHIIYKYCPPVLVYKEDVMVYSSEVYHTHKPYLRGFWMNVEYFENIESVVREAFKFKNIDERNFGFSQEMHSKNSVSIHIRRGDYLNNPIYNVCDESYYKKAIEYINAVIPNPHYYIFSDDIKWSEDFIKCFKVSYTLITQNRGKDSYKDMYLMSQCHHNIIANSSFSWWGAWLNGNRNKIVVAPNRWWNNSNKNIVVRNWKYLC